VRGAVLAGVLVAMACSATAEARSFALTDYWDARHGGFEASALVPVAPRGRLDPADGAVLRQFPEQESLFTLFST
jgi:hypothetical protein